MENERSRIPEQYAKCFRRNDSPAWADYLARSHRPGPSGLLKQPESKWLCNPALPSNSHTERASEAVHGVPIQVVSPAQRGINPDSFSNLRHNPAAGFPSGSAMLADDAIRTTQKNFVFSSKPYQRLSFRYGCQSIFPF